MNPERQRIEWIDLAKGICILIMVALHTKLYLPRIFYNLLLMPLFFIVSGMFFNEYDSFKAFLKKKTNSLIIPFLFFYLLIWIVRAILNYFQDGFWAYEGNFFTDIFGIYYLNLPIWYLLCIFWCNILFYILHKYIHIYVRGLIILALGIAGCYYWQYNFPQIMHTSTALVALPLFYIGHLLKGTLIVCSSKCNNISLCVAIFAIILVYWIDKFYYTNISWAYNFTDGNYLVFIILSTAISVALLIICKRIIRLPLISYCGRYSIVILCVHFIFTNIGLHIPNIIGHSDYVCLIEFLFSIIPSIIAIPILKNYCPYVVAQKNLF